MHTLTQSHIHRDTHTHIHPHDKKHENVFMENILLISYCYYCAPVFNCLRQQRRNHITFNQININRKKKTDVH